MSRFFPHAEFAEDQPLARTILTTHVATRAATMGSIIGAGVATGRHLLARPSPAAAAATTAAVGPLAPRLLRASGTGTAIGLALGGMMTLGRMYGREDIEWQDRSWRLLENEGQVETDDFTYAGAVAAPAIVAATGFGGGAARLGWRGIVGAGGLGTIAGMFAYLGWRYGIKGGFKEAKKEAAELKV